MSMQRIFDWKSRSRQLWTFIALTVAVALIIGVGGYFLLGAGEDLDGPARNTTVAHTGDNALVAAANAAARLESGGLCNRAVTRARAYGVLPANVRNSSKKVETEMAGRYTCKAEAQAGKFYTLAVDQRCDDLANHTCFVLRAVSNPVGEIVFQRRI